MEKEPYLIEQASEQADLLKSIMKEFGVDNYLVAEKILKILLESKVTGRINAYKVKYGKDASEQASLPTEYNNAEQQEIGIPEHETKISEKIRTILAHSSSAINTGLNSSEGRNIARGHAEYSQGSPEIAVSPSQASVLNSFNKILKFSPDKDREIFNKLQKEIQQTKPRSRTREKIYFLSSPNPGNARLIYEAIGGDEWIDMSGRGGQQIVAMVDGPLAEISDLAEIIKNDLKVVRELARQVVIERVGIDKKTWEDGGLRTRGNPLRPPYELWDSDETNEMFVYSEIGADNPTAVHLPY